MNDPLGLTSDNFHPYHDPDDEVHDVVAAAQQIASHTRNTLGLPADRPVVLVPPDRPGVRQLLERAAPALAAHNITIDRTVWQTLTVSKTNLPASFDVRRHVHVSRGAGGKIQDLNVIDIRDGVLITIGLAREHAAQLLAAAEHCDELYARELGDGFVPDVFRARPEGPENVEH